jgi:hypothetical protein
MPFVDAGRNPMLDALTAIAAYASVHTADPTAGSNEVTGGSPAYARKAVTWAAAASGAALANGTDPVWDIPAGTTCVAIGYWSAVSAGTFYGWSPLNGGVVYPFYAANTGDLFSVDAHGYSNGDQVYVHAVSGSALPTGVAAGTIYFIVTVSGDTFQLSATSGGSAIAISTDGAGMIQKVVPETFGAQGTLTQTDATLRLTA